MELVETVRDVTRVVALCEEMHDCNGGDGLDPVQRGTSKLPPLPCKSVQRSWVDEQVKDVCDEASTQGDAELVRLVDDWRKALDHVWEEKRKKLRHVDAEQQKGGNLTIDVKAESLELVEKYLEGPCAALASHALQMVMMGAASFANKPARKKANAKTRKTSEDISQEVKSTDVHKSGEGVRREVNGATKKDHGDVTTAVGATTVVEHESNNRNNRSDDRNVDGGAEDGSAGFNNTGGGDITSDLGKSAELERDGTVAATAAVSVDEGPPRSKKRVRKVSKRAVTAGGLENAVASATESDMNRELDGKSSLNIHEKEQQHGENQDDSVEAEMDDLPLPPLPTPPVEATPVSSKAAAILGREMGNHQETSSTATATKATRGKTSHNITSLRTSTDGERTPSAASVLLRKVVDKTKSLTASGMFFGDDFPSGGGNGSNGSGTTGSHSRGLDASSVHHVGGDARQWMKKSKVPMDELERLTPLTFRILGFVQHVTYDYDRSALAALAQMHFNGDEWKVRRNIVQDNEEKRNQSRAKATRGNKLDTLDPRWNAKHDKQLSADGGSNSTSESSTTTSEIANTLSEEALEPVLGSASERADFKRAHRVIEPVGTGSYGRVYAARWKNEKIAIKKMKYIRTGYNTNNSSTASGESSGAAGDELDGRGSPFFGKSTKAMGQDQQQDSAGAGGNTARKHMLQEVFFLRACATCKYVVRFLAAFDFGGEVWLATELIDGGTLADVSQNMSFSEAHVALIASDILLGVAYLHDQNIVHRDLKMANIMLSSKGRVKLIDFGLCAQLATVQESTVNQYGDSSSTSSSSVSAASSSSVSSTSSSSSSSIVGKRGKTGSNKKGRRMTTYAVTDTGEPCQSMVGSPYWIPPEMVWGELHGPECDVWSAGICMFELLVGERPNSSSPVRAMFYTATHGVDVSLYVHKGKKKRKKGMSEHAQTFLQSMLQHSADPRGTCLELLKTPFVKRKASRGDLRSLLVRGIASVDISKKFGF